ncbi:MAG: PD40 domain-containing protein [Chloroflexi bacterium]|nr:PD40 domain-containing protein [Chloroflexota bacterium]
MMEKSLKEALDAIARRNVPENTNLWPRIEAVLTSSVPATERRTFMQTLRAKPAFMLLFALLVFLMLSGVAYAIGRSLGYIPGFGLVEQGAPVRILKAPVSVTRQGVTVTVKSAILTPERTSLEYIVSGVPRTAYPENEAVTGCIRSPYLRLPDGAKIEVTGNMPPIPAEVQQAVFVLPCIFNTLPGTVPENWELPLEFVPAPPQWTVIPVTEILPSATPIKNADSSENPLTITRILDVGDRVVIMGEFRHEGLQMDHASTWSVKGIRIADATGREIPNQPSVDIEPPTPTIPEADAWLVQVPKAFTPPLEITYEVEITTPVGPEEQVAFDFDAGQNPQAGGEWTVNQDFKVGGYNLRLVSITSGPDGYVFHFRGDPGINRNWINVEIAGYVPDCDGGGGPEDAQEFSRAVCFASIPGSSNHFPTGRLQVIIHFQAVSVEQKTFQVKWMPDTPFITPTPKAGVCLTYAQWYQLAEQGGELPPTVQGKIVSTVNEGNRLPAIYVSNPAGDILQKVDLGAWPSLSPDGTHLAYSAPDGIRIRDLSSGDETLLGTDGYRLIWSPDNSRLIFTTTFALYLVNADGSGLRRIETMPSLVISPVGWLPDAQSIVYAVLDGDHFTLMRHDLQLGETKTLFPIQNKAGYGAISPDGAWVVFADRILGESNWGIFISRLDGSERRLIVEPQVPTAFTSVWSPDGQWLIVNTRDTEGNNHPVLVNPFTCQVIPLTNIRGTVEGWAR